MVKSILPFWGVSGGECLTDVSRVGALSVGGYLLKALSGMEDRLMALDWILLARADIFLL